MVGCRTQSLSLHIFHGYPSTIFVIFEVAHSWLLTAFASIRKYYACYLYYTSQTADVSRNLDLACVYITNDITSHNSPMTGMVNMAALLLPLQLVATTLTVWFTL